MAEESKLDDKTAVTKPDDEATAESSNPQALIEEEEDEDDNDEAAPADDDSTPKPTGAKKKKKSKRNKLKNALTGKSSSDDTKPTAESVGQKAMSGLTPAQIAELVANNPALAQELAKDLGIKDGDMSSKEAAEAMKKLSLTDIMTGLAASGKNAKDMASYKFWNTQPVPKFDDKKGEVEEGPIRVIDMARVRKEPDPLPAAYEWVTMDLTSKEEMQEVYSLLSNHYVEDEDARFRFNYSFSFLTWALLCPGWTKEWHVGVRAKQSKKLVAFISAIPVELRVRKALLKASEVNFLVIHKKLRGLRLAPVMIKEITRRCYLLGVYQALYTGGVVLPTPVSTCRYFHRALEWQKLYEVGFSNLPARSKPSYQVHKFALPEKTSMKGLRAMEAKDVDAVLDLLKRYLARTDMAPIFTKEEVQHWLLYTPTPGLEQVIWSYVVEDPETKKITDYVSFYSLQSTAIGNAKHEFVNAAYLFYYATEAAFPVGKASSTDTRAALKVRLNDLINDALILAKKFKFDVFNALTLLDNALFLEQQKFGKGDGSLHYYLYNYNTKHIAGGVDRSFEVDEKGLSGIGVVML